MQLYDSMKKKYLYSQKVYIWSITSQMINVLGIMAISTINPCTLLIVDIDSNLWLGNSMGGCGVEVPP